MSQRTAPEPVTFQPARNADGLLDLSQPPVNRAGGRTSVYAKDMEAWSNALVDENKALREQLAEAAARETRLNDEHAREIKGLRNKLRTAHQDKSNARTRADNLEAVIAVLAEIHDMFRSPIENFVQVSAIGSATGLLCSYDCGGLSFEHAVGQQHQHQDNVRPSLRVESAASNPVKMAPYTVMSFREGVPLDDDMSRIRDLHRNATVAMLEYNRAHLRSERFERLYNTEVMDKKHACGHTSLQHVKGRQKYLDMGLSTEAIDQVFRLLENGTVTSHETAFFQVILESIGFSDKLVRRLTRPVRRKTEPLLGLTEEELLRRIFGKDAVNNADQNAFAGLARLRMAVRQGRIEEMRSGKRYKGSKESAGDLGIVYGLNGHTAECTTSHRQP